jgi:cellulose synthase (UDP-forming)
MAAGYQVRYVPVVLAKGLCPESIHPFLNQQYRWCTGSLSLMISADFHAMALSWRQRLCFWSGFGYYLSTAITAFTALIPPIYLLWFDPHAIHDRNYLLLVPVVLAYPLVVFLHRGQWSFSVLRIQLAYSFAHAVAVWDTWRGHTAEWVATGATRSTPLSHRVSRIMCVWLLTVQVMLWVGIGRDLSAGILSLDNMYPLILFASFALYLQGPLIVATSQRPPTTAMIVGGAPA